MIISSNLRLSLIDINTSFLFNRKANLKLEAVDETEKATITATSLLPTTDEDKLFQQHYLQENFHEDLENETVINTDIKNVRNAKINRKRQDFYMTYQPCNSFYHKLD